MEKHLHIISFDVPYPADYGGVIEVFYKIKTLHQLGIKVHLHCYEYGRGVQPELDKFCEDVKYYRRCEGHKGFSHKLPYIVCSRSNKELTEDLLTDDYPILLEGIHCSYLLHDPRFDQRKVILRLHNVEYKYYRQLSLYAKSVFKKIYYLYESRLLKKYEKSISLRSMILAFTQHDAEVYQDEFGTKNIFCLPVFSPYEKVDCDESLGCFCLYHGNLSVAENEAAVIWLLRKVFNDINVPFVIAGKKPSMKLIRIANRYQHTCLITDPSVEEMQDIVAKAQINILPSFNCTGIKLKLLNALFNGKHCVVNDEAVRGTPLRPVCHLCNNPPAFKQKIADLYNTRFTREESVCRQRLLSEHFDNTKNGERLVRWIW
jgi:hypothetical protein